VIWHWPTRLASPPLVRKSNVIPSTAAKYTARGNLVAVISNGTAVLGLGNIGPLASKPVMEGKGVLFKKFAGVDVFDIEIDEKDPDKIVDIVASLEPTFGGINLEDIKAPECFYIEKKLRERMKIPVFHDDQHGTSIIVGSALLNALTIVGKKIEDIKYRLLRCWCRRHRLPGYSGVTGCQARKHSRRRLQGHLLRRPSGHGREQS
jgi:malic enzyme